MNVQQEIRAEHMDKFETKTLLTLFGRVTGDVYRSAIER